MSLSFLAVYALLRIGLDVVPKDGWCMLSVLLMLQTGFDASSLG